jgi:AcrR family transcriptional regulator
MNVAPDERVLDAVDRIIERDGLRGLSISSIADEAGISRVTMHRRGISVADCLVGVLVRASDDLRASLWPVATGSGDAAGRLDVGLRVLCEVAERHAGVVIRFFGEPNLPIPGRPGRTTSLEFIELFERLLRDGVADGTLSVIDPAREATLIANTVFWIYLHMTRAHGWPSDEATERAIAMATGTVRADPRGDC